MNKAVEIAVLEQQFDMCVIEIMEIRSLYPDYESIPKQKARHDRYFEDAKRFLRAIDLIEKAEVVAT